MTPNAAAPRSIIALLEAAVMRAFEDLGLPREYGEIVASSKAQKSDFQCNGAMAAAKASKGRKPRDIAVDIVQRLSIADLAEVEIAGPGFINFSVRGKVVERRANELIGDPRQGHRKTGGERIILDYGGANAAKAMHVGHLRSAVIGHALKNLLLFQGHQIIGDIHMGDWGLQMGQLITELKRLKPELPYFDEALSGPYPEDPPCTMDDLIELYPQASARSKSDPKAREEARLATAQLQAGRPGYRALWRHFVNVSVADLKRDYGKLGIGFDQWFGESRYQDRLAGLVDRLSAAGVTVKDEGALIIRLQGNTNSEMPPLMLQNSDEGFGYGATDLATLDERVADFGVSRVVYVTDARQNLHFEQVFAAARKSAIAPPQIGLEHLPFGTVNGVDGKPFKTREGGVMRLADLIGMLEDEARKRLEEAGFQSDASDEKDRARTASIVGLAALKFGDLQHDRESDYIFDLGRFSRFEGKTGPYIQYSCVRIKNLLAKAREAGRWNEPISIASDIEREIVLALDQFGNVIERACTLRKPHILAEHLFEIAGLFNQFYAEFHILTEQDLKRAGSRLSLCQLVLEQLTLGLALLGIEVPERM